VSDNGVGMDAETLSRVFEPFFTTKEKGVGTGLGLSTVYGIVKQHEGHISLYSEPGRGTTFKVLLPISQEAVAQEPEASQALDSWQASGTVLVVDDEPSVLLVAKHILGRAGFEVLTASDGLEGVEAFAEHMDKIRAVLLDMTMPKMNGEEAFTEMRRLKPDALIVLTSGFSEVEAAHTLASKGLAGFIPKPYRSQELLSKLREILEPS
jgi:two-component system cell cycle sensor histidine kinase/response regulator CckA